MLRALAHLQVPIKNKKTHMNWQCVFTVAGSAIGLFESGVSREMNLEMFMAADPRTSRIG